MPKSTEALVTRVLASDRTVVKTKIPGAKARRAKFDEMVEAIRANKPKKATRMMRELTGTGPKRARTVVDGIASLLG